MCSEGGERFDMSYVMRGTVSDPSMDSLSYTMACSPDNGGASDDMAIGLGYIRPEWSCVFGPGPFCWVPDGWMSDLQRVLLRAEVAPVHTCS